VVFDFDRTIAKEHMWATHREAPLEARRARRDKAEQEKFQRKQMNIHLMHEAFVDRKLSEHQAFQDKVAATIDTEKIPALDEHVQNAGTDVVNAKGGKGSATLSMAYAGARLGKAVLAGLGGRKRTECAYCKSDITDLPYFTQKVVFGEGGITKVLPLGELNEYETKRLDEAKAQLKTEIETGLKYAEGNSLA